MTRGRIPLKQQMRMNVAAMRSMAQTPEQIARIERDFQIAPDKPRSARKSSGVSEKKNVQDPVLELLRSHPKVAFAIRVNSGTFVETNDDGSKRFIQANNIGRKDMLVSDIIGMFRTGKFFAIECKHPDWKKPHGEREEKQANFLYLVEQNGGIAKFANSVDDVIRILEAV